MTAVEVSEYPAMIRHLAEFTVTSLRVSFEKHEEAGIYFYESLCEEHCY